MIKSKFSFSSALKNQISFHPWVYFSIFLVSLTFLSYFHFSVTAKLWIGILGLALPLVLGLETVRRDRQNEPPTGNFSEEEIPIPSWLWVLFFILLFFSRFYHLTTLPFWPISDEGTEAFLGMGQLKHWSWNLLWSPARVEPLMTWILGLYFKLIPPSFFSIRFFPAVVSLLTVLTAYWAARQFLSKSLSFFTAWILAFSFWDLTASRFCSLVILVPLFQCLCLGWLGIFLTARNAFAQWKSLLILTLTAGIGFYTWTNWAGVWLGLGFVLIVHSLNQKPIRWIFPLSFFLLSIPFSLPLLRARLSPGEMEHIHSEIGSHFCETFFQYLQALFEDSSTAFPFGSNWGGFLNPVLGAFVLIGCLFFIQKSRLSGLYYAIGYLFCVWLPSGLANGVEMYRFLPVLTVLMISASIGFLALILTYRGQLGSVLFLFIIGSFALDFYNYTMHYSRIEGIDPGKQWRTVQYEDAYRIIENLSHQDGPLYVFCEFNTDYENKTLNIAAYPFDALQNPSLAKAFPRWAVLIMNPQYAPFLIRTFPGLKFKVLKTDRSGPNYPPPSGIFLIPTSQIPPLVLDHWIQADFVYRAADLTIKNKNPLKSWGDFSELFLPLKEKFKDDRFLTTIYWEKCGFFKFLGCDFKTASEDYRNAIQQGIPAAHLYHDLGVSLMFSGRIVQANVAFKKAEVLASKLAM